MFVEDFAIDEKSRQIYILDRNSVKVYDISGRLLKTFDTPEKEKFFELEVHDDRLIFPKGIGFMPPLEKEWIITDLQGNIVAHKINNVKYGEIRVEYKANLCFESEENMFYWNQLNDTIFRIDVKPEAAFLFENDKFRLNETDFAAEENFRNKDSWQLLSILGTDRYLFFNYLLMKDSKMIHTVYDKKGMKFYGYSEEKLGEELTSINPIDNGPVFIPKSRFFNRNEELIIGWIDAYKVKTHVASEAFENSTPDYPGKKKGLEQLASSLNENDNPVLVIVKVKE